MRKAVLKFGMFLLVALLPTGCESDDENEIKGTIIEKIECGDELSDFLNEQLPLAAGGFPSFFYDKDNNRVKDIIIINSKEEFSSVFPEFKTALLDIDFSKYTLIIGHKSYKNEIGDKHPKALKKQNFYKAENGYIIELRCTYEIIKTGLAAVNYVNFWGVYPKLQSYPITIELKFE